MAESTAAPEPAAAHAKAVLVARVAEAAQQEEAVGAERRHRVCGRLHQWPPPP